jgi:hypothetical protein
MYNFADDRFTMLFCSACFSQMRIVASLHSLFFSLNVSLGVTSSFPFSKCNLASFWVVVGSSCFIDYAQVYCCMVVLLVGWHCQLVPNLFTLRAWLYADVIYYSCRFLIDDI